MDTITLSEARFNRAIENLRKYYDYQECSPIGINQTVIISTPLEFSELQTAYDNNIGEQTNRILILDTLALVSYYLREDSLGISPKMFDILNNMMKEDMLKLYLMIYDGTKDISWISIRTKDGSLKLKNYCNWFLDDMVKEYLKKNLPEIKNEEQAVRELTRIKRHRGRVPNDPRLTHLMWGTYSLLTDLCEFSSPMPNRLCQFIICYLQYLKVIPLETDIDVFWIRAQLRYIRSKKMDETNQE